MHPCSGTPSPKPPKWNWIGIPNGNITIEPIEPYWTCISCIDWARFVGYLPIFWIFRAIYHDTLDGIFKLKSLLSQFFFVLSPARSFRHLGSVLEEHGKAKRRFAAKPWTNWMGWWWHPADEWFSQHSQHSLPTHVHIYIYIPTYLPAYLPSCIYKCVYIYIDMKQAYEGTYVHKGKFGGMIMFTISHSCTA